MNGRFLAALATRRLLLDAGMGTRLIARGLDLATDDPAFWNLDRPEVVRAIHARDLAAGSDGVVSNTFGANAAWLARFGRSSEMAAINRRAVEIAREAAGSGRFVLGSIGPTAADQAGAHRAQAEALAGAGVDALMLETHDLPRALAGLAGLRGAFALPIVACLFAVPEPAEEAAARLEDAGADVVGINCAEPAQARAWVEAMARGSTLPLVLRPSASHPDGPALAPGPFAGAFASLGDRVRLVGGCCGATEAHVAALRQALDRARADGV